MSRDVDELVILANLRVMLENVAPERHELWLRAQSAERPRLFKDDVWEVYERLLARVARGETVEAAVDAEIEPLEKPRRFRHKVQLLHRGAGPTERWRYGCYFPMWSLTTRDDGTRDQGQGIPQGVEWIDAAPSPATKPAPQTGVQA